MLTKCGPVTNNRTQAPITHVTNLTVLSHFFSGTDLRTLASDTFLCRRVQAFLPDFSLYDHNYSASLAAIDSTDFALAKAANLSKSRQIVYRSMAEYLSHRNRLDAVDEDDIPFFSLPTVYQSPAILVSIVLSSLAFVFSVIIMIKLRAFSVVVVCHTLS